MTKKLLLFVFIVAALPVLAIDKTTYDLEAVADGKALHKATGAQYYGESTGNDIAEMTLIQGGYFTLGTKAGLSSLNLDDNCAITFGHPYALTSYPLLAIDGQWGKLADVFDVFSQYPKTTGDSIVLEYARDNYLEFTVTLQPGNEAHIFDLTMKVKNLHSESLTIGMGLVFDPALGKKGDGWVVLNGVDAMMAQKLTGNDIPQFLYLHERSGGAAGMKIMADLSQNVPETLILGNCHDVYENDTPYFDETDLRKLYDLTLKIFWQEQTIAAGAEAQQTLHFQLVAPDFSSTVFMRWDLPGFLAIENNLLFPRQFNSYVELMNTTDQSQNNLNLLFNFPDILYSNTTAQSVPFIAAEPIYQRVAMQSKEVYEDRIVDIDVTLKKGTEIIDAFHKPVFVPAVPLSDTGIVCTIDTVITKKYPQVSFIFEPKIEKTGQRIAGLSTENIFLYENDQRIRDFTLSPDTTGGLTEADIVFVLDVTGSMGDEIRKVKDNIVEFADSLSVRGIDYRLGIVCFLDVIENVYDFTDDIQLFQSYVAAQYAHGGGDTPENSLEALLRATQFSYRNDSKRTIIWITDADYHESDNVTSLTRQQVIGQLLLNGITVHCIGNTTYQTSWYNPIIEPTGGNFYDIYGNFRDILLDISRMRNFNKFMQ